MRVVRGNKVRYHTSSDWALPPQDYVVVTGPSSNFNGTDKLITFLRGLTELVSQPQTKFLTTSSELCAGDLLLSSCVCGCICMCEGLHRSVSSQIVPRAQPAVCDHTAALTCIGSTERHDHFVTRLSRALCCSFYDTPDWPFCPPIPHCAIMFVQ